MKSNHLSIYVEGIDDKFFVSFVFKKCFKDYTPNIIKYANQPDEKIIKKLEQLRNDDEHYIMLADKNSNSIKTKKQIISKEFNINESHVIIVNKCIESWYVSGSNIDFNKESIENTEDITKKKFKDLSGGTRLDSKETMQEILKNFDIEKAKQHNKSFKYFYENLESILK